MKIRFLCFILSIMMLITSMLDVMPMNVSAAMKSFETKPKIPMTENHTYTIVK